jgi:hypothetical protein
MIDWQPIETVPHDRRVIFYFPASASERVKDWIECGYFSSIGTLGRERVTHWADISLPTNAA